MKFGLLGSLIISDHNGRQIVSAPRQRVLLAALLLNANAVVRTEQLIEFVWDEDPPPGARATLQSYVMRLRRTLGDDLAGRLQTRPAGYTIEVREGELDVQRFAALHAAGGAAFRAKQWDLAAAQLRAGLALWRGEPLADIPSDLLQQGHVPRMAEMRMQALELRVEADLQRGGHREVVAELQQLVTEFPFRERLWESLLLALHRSGQQARALAAYQDVRRLMIDELGMEPGEGLQRIHHQILAASPPAPADLGSPPRQPELPSLLPADTADFTGRVEQVAAISELLRPGAGTAIAVVALAGKPGVGKTAMAVHVAHRMREVFADGQLYVNLHGMQARPAAPGEVLGRFLRALGVDGAAIPERVDQRAEIYRQRLAGKRILVVLDDAVGEAQIGPLLPGNPGCGVIITSRAPLTGLAGAHHMVLDVFPDDEAIRMLAGVAGRQRVAAEPGPAGELSRLCGRLPLAVRIAGAKLAAKPHWALADMVSRLSDERQRLDELAFGSLEVRYGLEVSYQSLTARARLLFGRLALLDATEFAPWVGAALLDGPLAEAEDLMEDLADARLLEASGRDRAGQMRYHFHDLVRVYARERAETDDPARDREPALTRALGAWLALTEHAAAKVARDAPAISGPAPRFDFDPVFTGHLVRHPLDWYTTERAGIVAAVGQAAHMGLSTLCWGLAAGAVPMFETRSHYDEWRLTHEQALAAVRRHGDQRGEAVMLSGLGALHITQHQYHKAAALLESALQLLGKAGPAEARIRALRSLAYIDRMLGYPDRAMSRYIEAHSLLRGGTDRLAESSLLRSMGSLYLELGNPGEALSHLEHAGKIARDFGDLRGQTMVLYRLGELHLTEGHLGQAEKILTEALANVDNDIHNVRGQAYARYGLGLVRFRQGDHDQAAALLTNSLTIAREVGDHLIETRALLALAEYNQTQRRPAIAITLLTEALTICRWLKSPIWLARTLNALADAYDASGDTNAARRCRNRASETETTKLIALEFSTTP